MAMTDGKLQVEVWSDIMCPFCWLGKRRFEQALASSGHADDVEVTWRSFQLMPHVRTEPGLSTHDFLAREKGIPAAQARALNERLAAAGHEAGLPYAFDEVVVANTMRGHRLLHLAKAHGLQGAMADRLFRAHFAEGRNVDDPEVLVELGRDAGLPEQAVREMLAGDAYVTDVEADIGMARELGIGGVPFFVLGGRYGVSGAQSPEVFAQAIERAFADDR